MQIKKKCKKRKKKTEIDSGATQGREGSVGPGKASINEVSLPAFQFLSVSSLQL